MTLEITDIQKELIAKLPASKTPWKIVANSKQVVACNPEHPPRILWRDREDGEIYWKEIDFTEADFNTPAGKEFQKHLRRASAQTFIDANAGRPGFRAIPKKKRRF